MRRGINNIPHALEDETKAGLLLMASALAALIIANSPWRHIYEAVSEFHFGPESLHLNLSVAHWAGDGLLTIFFFVVGLELKTEFVTGSLRDLREAALPMLAAVFGMIGPALLYVVIQFGSEDPAFHGWAIPTATDIAFAVAILGIFGRGLPPAVRTFLLTLAVVDDLLAIIVIAVFYTSDINFMALGLSLLFVAFFALLVNRRITYWWLLIPIALVAWAAMHASGVHATIAGVLMGLSVPAVRRAREPQMTHAFVEKLHPWSAGLALPLFAFFSAGVNIVDSSGIMSTLTDPVTVGIIIGMPIGKIVGVFGSVVILTQFTSLHLGNGVGRRDILPISVLCGIGFTVALLISGLAFPPGSEHVEHGKLAVLMGTIISATLGSYLVSKRAKRHIRH
ncbi:Na+/H+ antiporter NhaA [Boudabousia liubingyangii]|uniref:Na(+)/H(+) antiporter NhaA n=1 Tax=Boudabousia liubingyangii TaxID=1921764 RepID=A0A1Q5PJY5_9ACTO|nr:Na+/H+ antiporter NhaA [Boudabousia liubingyangii]OKL46524.1 Na+/H+ antiporter NhaA [Boudabousia liubingyangii]